MPIGSSARNVIAVVPTFWHCSSIQWALASRSRSLTACFTWALPSRGDGKKARSRWPEIKKKTGSKAASATIAPRDWARTGEVHAEEPPLQRCAAHERVYTPGAGDVNSHLRGPIGTPPPHCSR